MISSHVLYSSSSSTAHARNRRYLYTVVCIVNLLVMCCGTPFAWSSSYLPVLENKENLHCNPLGRLITKSEASRIASLLGVGGLVGPPLAAYSASRIGRKPSLLLTCAIPYLACYLLLANAKTIYLYYVARILAGWAVSSALTVIPLYAGEISEDVNRGLICSSITTFLTTGELLTYIIGPYVKIFHFGMACVGLMLVTTVLIIFVLPESPYYLSSIGDDDGAELVLMELRQSVGQDVRDELRLIKDTVEDCNENKGKMSDIFKSKCLRRAMITTVSLTFFQHCSGVIPILFYCQTIFKESGTKLPSEICAMVIGFVQWSASFITPILVDKIGRRIMLIVSSIGMCICEVFLGLYFFYKNDENKLVNFHWLPITCLVGYMISYIIGFGPLIWTIMAEIFPANMKAAAATITVSSWWTFAFICSRTFHPVSEIVGMSGIFWCYACDCACALIFVSVYVIETKGKSFVEIQQMLSN